MKVILLQDVKSLGKKGQIVDVNDGYARNFILPKKLGQEATAQNLNTLKLQKANEAKVAQENLDKARAFADELSKLTVVVGMKAGEGGKLFGSVSSKEIAEEAKTDPELVKSAPHDTPIGRVDDVLAAKHPVTTYKQMKNEQD